MAFISLGSPDSYVGLLRIGGLLELIGEDGALLELIIFHYKCKLFTNVIRFMERDTSGILLHWKGFSFMLLKCIVFTCLFDNKFTLTCMYLCIFEF